MKLNIGHDYKHPGWTSVPVGANLDDYIDDGEAQEIRCCFALSMLPFSQVKTYLDGLVKKLAIGGTMTVQDLDFWRLSDAYFWERIDARELNKHLMDCRSYIDSELVRNLVKLTVVRSKIVELNFLIEFKRDN